MATCKKIMLELPNKFDEQTECVLIEKDKKHGMI
jgi:hypothetical protein